MSIWASKSTNIPRTQADMSFMYSYADALRQESELAINIRKATSIEEVSPKRAFHPTVENRDRSLPRRREACSSMHCVYMGPQELPELLAGHESVC